VRDECEKRMRQDSESRMMSEITCFMLWRGKKIFKGKKVLLKITQ